MRIEITSVDAGAARPLPITRRAQRRPEHTRARRGALAAQVSLQPMPTAWTTAPVRWDAVRAYARSHR